MELRLAVVPDRFDRAVVHRILAERFFFLVLRLLVDVGEAFFVVALEVRGSGLATEIAVDALGVDVIAAGRLAGHFVVGICHEYVMGGADREVRRAHSIVD